MFIIITYLPKTQVYSHFLSILNVLVWSLDLFQRADYHHHDLCHHQQFSKKKTQALSILILHLVHIITHIKMLYGGAAQGIVPVLWAD